jgi:Fe-S-cluster containining protein
MMAQQLLTEIQTIEQLKKEMDLLWSGIEQSCATCCDPDCLGYNWIMPEEENIILETGASTVQINGAQGPLFIDSYPRDKDGALIVNSSKPPCPYRDKNGRCLIHMSRPLVCHMYPLGLETTPDGFIVWGIHTDCSYIRYLLSSEEKEALFQKIKKLINRISPNLNDIIVGEYRKIEVLLEYPNGFNNYLVIQEV